MLDRSTLPPILQHELKLPRSTWQQRLVLAIVSFCVIAVLMFLFSLPFLTKIGK